MQTKEIFISNKTLSSWWGQIANDSRFDSVLLHASGMAFEASASQEQREGILTFKNILLTMAIAEAPSPSFPSPGIRHDLDQPRKTVKPPEVKQPDKPKKK